MINSGGSIVNVASSGGICSRAYSSPEYGAAKAGLIRFTSCVADWADSHRIRVNCVAPHWIGRDRGIVDELPSRHASPEHLIDLRNHPIREPHHNTLRTSDCCDHCENPGVCYWDSPC